MCAYILEYDQSLLSRSSYKHLIVGLDEDADGKNCSYPLGLGRTFAGLSFESPEGSSDPVLILAVAESATCNTMVDVLSDFGATSPGVRIMLDGSGSSQLRTKNRSVYGTNGAGADKRFFPQAIYVREGN